MNIMLIKRGEKERKGNEYRREKDPFQVAVSLKNNNLYGGGGEIRTHGRVAPTTIFKTVAFNRSATPPSQKVTGR